MKIRKKTEINVDRAAHFSDENKTNLPWYSVMMKETTGMNARLIKDHRKLVVFLSLILFTTLIFSINPQDQYTEIKFERISTDHGLSQSSVFCILQDSRGFMWFGTQHGLNRYDGHTFKLYEQDPRNLNRLSNGFVLSIFEDKQGMLWIGTLGGGLNKFDRNTEKFTIYKNNPGDPTRLSNDNVWSIHEDKSDILWIGTDNGLNRYNKETDNFRNYKKEPEDYLQNKVRIIYEDRAGVLWVGTDDGLQEYNRERDTFILYQNKPGEESNHNKVRAICEDEVGVLWIGTEGGLQKFDGGKGKFIKHQVITNNFTALKGKPISTLYYEDQSGILWIGTRREGLYRLNTKEKKVTLYRNNPKDSNTLSHNDVRAIYTDRSGLIWIGTDGGGINKFDPKRKKFTIYRNIPDGSDGFNNDVMAVCKGKGGVIWIGTRGGGVNRFDPNNKKFTHYKIGADVTDNPNRDSIHAICEDRTGELWVGTERAGLYWFDKEMDKCNLFKKGPISSEENILDIYVDEGNVLWIGSLDGGLIKIEEDREKYKNYKNTPGDTNSLSNNKVYSIFKDNSGIFWIGTAGGGLNKFDKEKEKFKCYRPIIGNNESLSHDFIFTVYEDNLNTLWIGTNGGGLNKFDREKETFTAYTMKDGLPNNVIYAILEDKNGNLWLSTNKGLSKFNPNTKEFRNYTIRDGLQGYEFNREVACEIKSGEMFFGGITGLNSFYPEKLEVKSSAPPIVITSFKRWNKDAKLDKSISEIKKIVLSYNDDFISFEFAALSFTDPEVNQYAYKLEPVNEDWIRLGNKHDIDFPNLEPGEYTFRVKGSNNDGVWNEEGTSIKIIVNPPLWETWWFRTLFALLIAGAIFVLVRRRIRNIEKANILLKKEMTALKEGLFTDTLKNPENFSEIITQSKQMHAIFHYIETIEKSNLPVLITGETGTGKELIARAIHKVSGREGNFVEKKVGGLDDTEFKKELLSLMGQAENGTLFLDEIGDISPHSQVTLLRLIKLREYSPLGKEAQQPTNVHIVTATNRDLKAMIERGEFRRDLYFRLKIHEIDLPPLRERKEDIPLLVDHFLEMSAKKLNKKDPDVPEELFPMLQSYNFPGNITELGGMVYNAMNIQQDGILSLVDIFQQIIREQARKMRKYSHLGILSQRLKKWKKLLIKKNRK